MTAFEIGAITAVGLCAGIVNTMAGGGSLVTVPLLVTLGMPGTLANGTNRVAVVAQSLVAAWTFRAEGVSGFRRSVPVLLPLLAGSAIGAIGVSQLDDRTFERAFGVVMLALLVPAMMPPRIGVARAGAAKQGGLGRFALFFSIGLYGGAFQAGVGILLVLALARAGHDLVSANAIKVVVVAAFTAVAVVVFVSAGHVAWAPAAVLTVATSAGAVIGARIAVRGGERVIRPVLALSVLALAGKMLGLYG